MLGDVWGLGHLLSELDTALGAGRMGRTDVLGLIRKEVSPLT